MIIKVFGQIADIIGSNSFEVTNIAHTDELVKNLQEKYPSLKKSTYKIAVNRNIIQTNTTLLPNAEVALLPPFSGG